MKKLFWVVVCLNFAVLAGYLWQKAPAEAELGGGGGAPTGNGNGDLNGDGERDISDAIYLLIYLFSGGPEPVACAQAGDLNPEVESLRIAAPDGSGQLAFGPGPTDDCSIGIDSKGGLPGLLLRDPRGIRVLTAAPDGTNGARLLFGPTDDCSIGIDPAFPGLVERDPIGFRLMGRNNQGCRLIFGPTMDCTVEVDPAGPAGLLLRDPRGIRILSPGGAGGTGMPTLRFGPTDDCSIGIDPTGAQGLLLRDPRGIRILSPSPNSSPRLIFGPTDDCSIGIDPAFPGLVERDPIGFRLLGRNNEGCRLIFGPTMDCTIEVNPRGPSGLLLRDPSGIRILGTMDPTGMPTLPTLRFGPTDDCSIGIDPAFPGLVERDPIGFRLLGRDNQGCRLIFGPTMDCTVEVDPAGPAGLLLRDPKGIRILSPAAQPGQQPFPNRLIFGPTDDCTIGVDPQQPGLLLRDPRGFCFEGGPVKATQFIQTSSRRFKREVKPIEDALAKVQKLNGVTFQWDEAHGGARDIGFIAEEVAEVLPEVVQRDADTNAVEGMNYGHVAAVAVEGIKAQQREIDDLRSRNAALEKELSALKAQMALIASQVGDLTRASAASSGR